MSRMHQLMLHLDGPPMDLLNSCTNDWDALFKFAVALNIAKPKMDDEMTTAEKRTAHCRKPLALDSDFCQAYMLVRATGTGAGNFAQCRLCAEMPSAKSAAKLKLWDMHSKNSGNVSRHLWRMHKTTLVRERRFWLRLARKAGTGLRNCLVPRHVVLAATHSMG